MAGPRLPCLGIRHGLGVYGGGLLRGIGLGRRVFRDGKNTLEPDGREVTG